jgi:hypothetical protein
MVVRVTKGFAQETSMCSPILVTEIFGNVSCASNFCDKKRIRKKITSFCMVLERVMSDLQFCKVKINEC